MVETPLIREYMLICIKYNKNYTVGVTQTKCHSMQEKESFHILSRLYKNRGPDGGNFRLLGICFDPKLLMGDAVHECVAACLWKIQRILRAKRFYSTAELIGLYKAHILSYIEYRTPAIAHVAATVLTPIDSI